MEEWKKVGFSDFDNMLEPQSRRLEGKIAEMKKKLLPQLLELFEDIEAKAWIDEMRRTRKQITDVPDDQWRPALRHLVRDAQRENARKTEQIADEQEREASLSDIAALAIDKIGKPTHYKVLLEFIEENIGFKVPGENPGANLLAHISRDSRFKKFEGRGVWGLREWKEITYGGPDGKPVKKFVPPPGKKSTE